MRGGFWSVGRWIHIPVKGITSGREFFPPSHTKLKKNDKLFYLPISIVVKYSVHTGAGSRATVLRILRKYNRPLYAIPKKKIRIPLVKNSGALYGEHRAVNLSTRVPCGRSNFKNRLGPLCQIQ